MGFLAIGGSSRLNIERNKISRKIIFFGVNLNGFSGHPTAGKQVPKPPQFFHRKLKKKKSLNLLKMRAFEKLGAFADP